MGVDTIYGYPVYSAKPREFTDCTVIEFGTFEMYGSVLVPVELTQEDRDYWDFEDAVSRLL